MVERLQVQNIRLWIHYEKRFSVNKATDSLSTSAINHGSLTVDGADNPAVTDMRSASGFLIGTSISMGMG